MNQILVKPPVQTQTSLAAAGAVLTIDLDAVRENYRRLKARLGSSACAGVVKADGYGLGAEAIARALTAERCDTFFVAHVGGPPFQVYALPIRLDPKVLSGTAAIFFAATNALKLVPYFALGQFDTTNLTASAVLMPLAPLSTIAGAWLVRRMRPEIFYPFTYATVAVVAVKLLWDGIAGLM